MRKKLASRFINYALHESVVIRKNSEIKNHVNLRQTANNKNDRQTKYFQWTRPLTCEKQTVYKSSRIIYDVWLLDRITVHFPYETTYIGPLKKIGSALQSHKLSAARSILCLVSIPALCRLHAGTTELLRKWGGGGGGRLVSQSGGGGLKTFFLTNSL